MTTIAYVGMSHYRGLSQEDFLKYLGENPDFGDVEFGANPTDSSDKKEQLWFKQGEPVEVTDAMAKVLLENADFAGEFAEPEEKADAPEPPKETGKPKVSGNPSGSLSAPAGSDGSSGAAGSGSSTAGDPTP